MGTRREPLPSLKVASPKLELEWYREGLRL